MKSTIVAIIIGGVAIATVIGLTVDKHTQQLKTINQELTRQAIIIKNT